MKISYNWLKTYINIDISAEKASELLTACGLEVESIEKIESVKGGLQGIVIGEVKTCIKHPDADKLSITTVDIGAEELLHIVCGAPNVATGQKVPVATIGTVLYSGDEAFTIKKSKIRGELSEGMICAEDELGLGHSHAGIMVLDAAVAVGTPARDYFKIEDDYMLEIGLTPNRSDATSHIGVARDLTAVINNLPENNKKVKLTYPSVADFKTDNHNLPIEVIVEDTVACPRYTGITLSGIKVQESPDWLKNKLKTIGLRPINNIVDITNYVLFETGQPLHAFDADKISGKKVIIKKLAKNTLFVTLDGTERKLSGEDLMICNVSEGMCIAGVFGGAKSGVTAETTAIFLESAYFDPTTIRKTSKHHGLKTDASFRYERGCDPNITRYALKRAITMMKEIAGGNISSEIVDVYPNLIECKSVDVSYKNIYRLIGKVIDKDIIKNILLSLEIEITNESNEGLSLLIPTNKVDVSREADVIEEILRIYGYNNVEIGDELHSSLAYIAKPDKEKVQNTISDYLSNNGFVEIMNNSLTSAEYVTKVEAFKSEMNVKILNPLSKELDVMRQTLLFGGLESISYNINRKSNDLKLYEFGNTYTYNTGAAADANVTKRFKEEKHLAVFVSGKKYAESWNLTATNQDIFNLKAYVMNILHRMRINASKLKMNQISDSVYDEALEYTLNDKRILIFGSLQSKLLLSFDIKQAVYYADFQWDNIIKMIPGAEVEYTEVPKFPEVRRDLALLINKEVSFAEIEQLAYQTEKNLLKNVNLFDVYEGEKLEAGKKSYAVSFIIQDKEKTLNDKQIDGIMNRLIKVYSEKLGAVIR
ncbi:MAG: phenylalanine--tRNA ligase subunit beta [Bacteroidetes bacterium]|nr:phenylalanine--tRNA ligase subunit beta [Bacteroidota bacterium]